MAKPAFTKGISKWHFYWPMMSHMGKLRNKVPGKAATPENSEINQWIMKTAAVDLATAQKINRSSQHIGAIRFLGEGGFFCGDWRQVLTKKGLLPSGAVDAQALPFPPSGIHKFEVIGAIEDDGVLKLTLRIFHDGLPYEARRDVMDKDEAELFVLSCGHSLEEFGEDLTLSAEDVIGWKGIGESWFQDIEEDCNFHLLQPETESRSAAA